jgi:hypothetical protein
VAEGDEVDVACGDVGWGEVGWGDGDGGPLLVDPVALGAADALGGTDDVAGLEEVGEARPLSRGAGGAAGVPQPVASSSASGSRADVRPSRLRIRLVTATVASRSR